MKPYSPTTPSRRQMTTVDYGVLSKARPEKRLLRRLKAHAGRNSAGRITMRHQGGGHKKLYRLIDFKQDKPNQPARVETLEYDPYRTAFIAKLSYPDGDKRYILAPHGLKEGDEIVTSESAPLKTGNRLKLKNIPVGYQVYNVELTPGRGGQLVRSAGSSAEVLSNAQGYTDLKLSSGEVRRVSWEGYASLGQVSNPEHNLTVIGKAGRSRWLGVRPTVRGTAMNPVDHPYGGGEGRTQRGTRKPKTKWGKVTGGRKTRNPKKRSSKFIVARKK
ncbi:MAG: 50S ribosomal protein L2 [Candidatus Liptonbacteria bacterium RIFCSPLOWO2_01_FULL_56_20]|uniref:Large ribosomal subunit protein uL2 n=1 Tax=Candidatus Liptonbacteria bacterium RIFCSPLOWO2_01_FULL_56_20 TaxID=1798652 RepID=A0A1G2CLG0_9BACT|nr:MAG: 50S ribosomal protein L2 [Candidatus Liptonbacteria bacterium RIFCSPHIGHO2_01_FULL_56_18b]OGZ01570.1 MAG: 50S ribosomal protein L2 [Candidatus Liptonbacteria bacterium RIFCSPLOWO2_01_FULL_56_20]